MAHSKDILANVFTLVKLVAYYRGICTDRNYFDCTVTNINEFLAMFALISVYIRQSENIIKSLALSK